MDIKMILGKLIGGESLTDEEKAFAQAFDLQAQLDKAASGARRKAESERDALKNQLVGAEAELAELREKANDKSAETTIKKLSQRLEALEKARADAEAKATALQRNATVRQLAKDAGINPAKGIDSKALDMLVDNLLRDVDLEDATAVKTALDGFKSANAGMIAAAVIPGVGPRGGSTKLRNVVENPFDPKTFSLTKQCELAQSDPALFAELKAAAANK